MQILLLINFFVILMATTIFKHFMLFVIPCSLNCLGESVFDVAIIQTVLSHHNVALSSNTVTALEKNDFW